MLKKKTHYILIVALLFACRAQTFGQTVVPSTQEQVEKLVDVLKSAAPLKEKMDACRLLSIVGTKDAVAPLAALLGDEQLSHMARYGLETIHDPAADDAFRSALGRVKGRLLVGIIGSIGVRKDVKAIEPLKKMLTEQRLDDDVKRAIAGTLGSIGNTEATEALLQTLENASGQDRLDVCEGLFRCAELFMKKGELDKAIAVYDRMCKLDGPHQVRGGALRGAILARGNDGLGLLRQCLQSDDYILFSAAVQTAQEIPGVAVTNVLTDEIKMLKADNQILVIQTLGERADAEALPAIFPLAKSGDKYVRIAAIRSLAQIADDSVVPVLVELLDEKGEIMLVAQESLASIPGKQADDAVIEMLNSNRKNRRLISFELISRRRMNSGIPALLEAAADDDSEIRSLALKKLAEMGTIDELPALLDLLIEFRSSKDVEAVQRVLSAICMKADNPQSQTKLLTVLLSRAEPMQKSTLLSVLAVVGGPEALKAVRSYVTDMQEVVRDAAIRALCSWKTVDAAPHLIALAKETPLSSRKTATLRGYINLIRDESLSAKGKLEMCRQAAALIDRSEEKQLLLGVLGTVASTDGLAMALTYLNDPLVRNEAGFAVVAVCEKIVQQNPDEVADAVGKVLKATNNESIIRRARDVLNKAK
ncbi:MAG: HEAT repeat domain-containing protein [Sedimentisphaerales bacterium]|nr:HEAT repeat domain-containing protein [Sedimentisphaerales bacterium]